MRAAVAGAAIACGLAGGAAAAPDLATFRSDAWGVTVRYPAGLAVGTAFHQSYFDRGAWRFSYAADAGPGTRILAFALPELKTSDAGGDGTAFAELRIGASRDPDVLPGCLTYGMNSGNNVESDQRTVGGVTFAEVPDNGDTEMMKTIKTDDLRAVRDGTCWAIDLVVYVGGTSNRLPAYSDADIAKLRGLIATIRFD